MASPDPDDSRFSKADVEVWMRVQDALDGGSTTRKIDGLIGSTRTARSPKPRTDSFSVKQIRGYTGEPAELKTGLQGKPQAPLWRFKLRESWSDVLAIEDPTAETAEKNETYKDLKGAKFSWERNLKTDQDTWIAQAAIVLPLVYVRGLPAGDSGVGTWGLTPSATINRLQSEADASKEVDQLTFRGGGFLSYYTGLERGINAVVVRGGFAYQTDTGFDASIPAGELELEPRIDLHPTVAIGYRRILWEHSDPAKPEAVPEIILAYQARLRVRAEYGEYHRPPSDDGLTLARDECFLHLGGKAGIAFAPFFHKRLMASADISYLPTVSGPHANDLLFQAELALELWKSDSGQQGGLSIKYVNGGLGFDQAEVETLYVGLSALF